MTGQRDKGRDGEWELKLWSRVESESGWKQPESEMCRGGAGQKMEWSRDGGVRMEQSGGRGCGGCGVDADGVENGRAGKSEKLGIGDVQCRVELCQS